MRVLIDTNVLFSAVYRPGSVPHQALMKAATHPFRCLVCEQCFSELRRKFTIKFPDRVGELDVFIEIVESLVETIPMSESAPTGLNDLRDLDDIPILHAAIAAKADIIISGDLDFLESNVPKPIIMKAADFVKLEYQ